MSDDLRRIVAIGGSWGGMDAVGTVLAALPSDFPAPVVVVLHRSPRGESNLLEAAIARRSVLSVCEADDKTRLVPGCVLVAPPDYHLLVEDGYVTLSTDAPLNFSRPSIDVLFDAAADAYGSRAVAVVLTGANEDGAHGVRAILAAGGEVIVQDPETAVRREMPDAAIAAGATRIVPLEGIAPLLTELLARSSR